MTKTTRCLLCVALICAIALLLPAVRAQAEGENPTYAYDSATKTLTITPGTSGLIGKEIQNESDYYSKWTKEVEKVIIAGDIRGIGTIGEDHNLVDGVFLTWRKLKEVEYQGKTQFYVGDYAFYACGELASFPLEWAVDFGYGAMMQSALEEVKIPHLQGNIGDCAFWLITPLKTVDITIENGQNRNTYIGTKAFASDYSRVPNLTSVTIRGEGTLEFGSRHPDMDLGQMFSYQTQLETVDLSGFSGDLSFGSAAFFQDASLKEIKLNPASKITYIGYDTFSVCENLDLSSWNFANLTGIIDQAGFGIRSWGDVMYGRGVLSDFTSLDLSNVKEIATFAFTAESEYEGYGYTKLESVNLSSLERLHSFLPGTSVNQVQSPVLSRGLAEIRPADVTIYMGGSGYQGAIDGAGTALGEGSGFPVPGYIITPPAGVTDFDASQATLKYENGTDIRRWTIVTYDGVSNAAHNIYRFQPVDPTNRVYVRMQFKAGDTAVSVDEVDFSEYLYQDLTMEVYGVGIEAGYVTLEYKGVEYPIVAGTGMLKVRGTTEQELYGAVASSADGVEQELPGVVAPDDTIYKINNRQVRVEKDEGVALLFDDIIEVNDDAQGNNNTELLMARTDDILEEKMGSENIPVFPGTGERHYEFKYLDLVDKNNGNVWVAANQDIVVYWPLPEGTDQNTQFALLHFEGLHREMSVGDVKDDIQTCTVTAEKITVTENHIVFTVHPAGFSPFGLVWENEGGGKGTGELAVSKTVSGVGGDTGKAFHFTVTLDDAAISGQYGEMTFVNGVADFTLTHGQTVTAESLPAGTVYKVTEAEAGMEGYSTSFTGATGTIPDGGIANASFTNTKSSLVSAGSLTISKTVIGSGDKAGKFTFAITITDAQGTELSQSFPYDGSRRGMLVSGGEIALGDGESVTIQSIPAGSRYVVTEVESNQNGYVTTASGEKGSIAEEATSVAAFTNRLEKAAPPQTGDTGTPRLWTALSLASLGGLLLAFVGKRACRRKHS